MNQILPHALWIGTTGDLRDPRRLYDVGIRAVVQLAYEEAPAILPRDFVVCRFPLVDGSENAPDILALAISTVTHLLEAKFACLVCCQAGLSRSPVIAAAAISRVTKQSLMACVELVGKHRACSIHAQWMAQIQSLEGPTRQPS